MPKGQKLGGRIKGTPNKRTQTLLEIAEKNNCNPFEVLVWFASGDYESLGYLQTKTVTTKDGSTFEELTISPELRQKSARDACEYLHPKRKAVEHTFNPLEMDDDELIKETAKILVELKGNKS
jgi:hypothetical protein